MQRLILFLLLVTVVSLANGQGTWRSSTTEGNRIGYYYDATGGALRLLSVAGLGQKVLYQTRFSSAATNNRYIVGCSVISYLGTLSDSIVLKMQTFTGDVDITSSNDLAGLRANYNSLQYAQAATFACMWLLIQQSTTTATYFDEMLYVPIGESGVAQFRIDQLLEAVFTVSVGTRNLLVTLVDFE